MFEPLSPVTRRRADPAVFLQARLLLADPAAWVKGAFGYTDRGHRIYSMVELNHLLKIRPLREKLQEQATCFCLEGAVIAFGGSQGDHKALIEALAGHSPHVWQDDSSRQHGEVLALLEHCYCELVGEPISPSLLA